MNNYLRKVNLRIKKFIFNIKPILILKDLIYIVKNYLE